jgi:hypothetical protein
MLLLRANEDGNMKDIQRPVLNDAFKLEKFDKEILLYSVTDTRAVYLNETAYLVYAMFGAGKSVGEIIALLTEAYPEQEDSIREDVTTVLDQLVENGVVVLND